MRPNTFKNDETQLLDIILLKNAEKPARIIFTRLNTFRSDEM